MILLKYGCPKYSDLSGVNMRRNFLIIGATAAFFSLVSLSNTYAQSGRSTITGFVFGPQRTPVAQVYVELKTDFNSTIGRSRTDGSGRYSFLGVQSGRFSVTVLPLGTDFEQQTQEVEIAGVNARGQPIPENVQKDFYLRPRKTAPSTVNQVVFAQEIPSEAKKAYDRAVSDLGDQKTTPGVEGLIQALKLYPDYFLALERLGVEFVKQERYEEAKIPYRECVRVNPRSYSCWYGLGYSAYSTQDNDTAIESLKRAVIIDKSSATALLILGISQRQAKQYTAAEESMLKAKEQDKGRTPDINWNLALLYAHNLKKYKDAAEELELFLKIDPENKNAENIKKLIKQFRDQAAKTKS